MCGSVFILDHRRRTERTSGCTGRSNGGPSNQCSAPAPGSNGSSTVPDGVQRRATTRCVRRGHVGRYSRSRLAYPERLRTPECRGHFLIKHVTDASTFRFQQRLLYIANALVNQHIGLEETDDGVWATYFKTVLLATLDELDFVIRG